MLLTMQSKTAATHKLEQLIVQGRSRAGEVVDHVMNNQPSDRLARGEELSFAPDAESNAVRSSIPTRTLALSRSGCIATLCSR